MNNVRQYCSTAFADTTAVVTGNNEKQLSIVEFETFLFTEQNSAINEMKKLSKKTIEVIRNRCARNRIKNKN